MKEKSSNCVIKNCEKVKVEKSRIINAGKGLFAVQPIKKDAIICTYGGKLIDAQDAKYIDPMYIVSFENGKGFKLVGDDAYGNLGIYANAVHPEFPEIEQNAKFYMRSKKILPGNRGIFNIVARQDIAEGEEIIVNYGDGYWLTMQTWNCTPHPVKPIATVKRDERAKRRQEMQ